jgi:hypothetical protein
MALHIILHGDLVVPDAPVELGQQSRSFIGDNRTLQIIASEAAY